MLATNALDALLVRLALLPVVRADGREVCVEHGLRARVLRGELREPLGVRVALQLCSAGEGVFGSREEGGGRGRGEGCANARVQSVRALTAPMPSKIEARIWDDAFLLKLR